LKFPCQPFSQEKRKRKGKDTQQVVHHHKRKLKKEFIMSANIGKKTHRHKGSILDSPLDVPREAPSAIPYRIFYPRISRDLESRCHSVRTQIGARSPSSLGGDSNLFKCHAVKVLVKQLRHFAFLTNILDVQKPQPGFRHCIFAISPFGVLKIPQPKPHPGHSFRRFGEPTHHRDQL